MRRTRERNVGNTQNGPTREKQNVGFQRATDRITGKKTLTAGVEVVVRVVVRVIPMVLVHEAAAALPRERVVRQGLQRHPAEPHGSCYGQDHIRFEQVRPSLVMVSRRGGRSGLRVGFSAAAAVLDGQRGAARDHAAVGRLDFGRRRCPHGDRQQGLARRRIDSRVLDVDLRLPHDRGHFF